MVLKSNFEAFFQDTFYPVRYNSKRLDIKVLISRNGLLFKALKITPFGVHLETLVRDCGTVCPPTGIS